MKWTKIILLIGAIALNSCGTTPTVDPVPTPTVAPTATPTTSCPIPSQLCVAREWKIGLRECADVEQGGTCLVDTTPFFVGGRCNAESSGGCPENACGKRRECEPDPFREDSFPVLNILSGAANVERVSRNCTPGFPNCDAPGDNSYQWRFVHVVGRVKFSVCWPLNAVDQHGDAIDLSGASCGVATIDPQ